MSVCSCFNDDFLCDASLLASCGSGACIVYSCIAGVAALGRLGVSVVRSVACAVRCVKTDFNAELLCSTFLTPVSTPTDEVMLCD